MASHFARWALAQCRPKVHRVQQQLIEYSSIFDEKRRSRFLAGRALLAELMFRVYGIPKLPGITVSGNGRPHFSDPDLPDFSFAYAGNVVGVLLGDEGERAGLDMEMVRAHSRQTLENQFEHLSSGEKAWLNAQSDAIEASTQLWTLRQSILKLIGEGINSMDSLQLHPASGRLRSVNKLDIQALCDAEPSLVWSCALSPGNDRLNLWEYKGDGGWESLREINLYAQNMAPSTLRLTSLPAEKQLPHS
ncbi:4'-phosphopantetheinyl transferase family protein [Erwinia pyrifoliae]|uniref:4'-phosphopantetheinyl transferase superfamily protein n=1 Tax=Erwinia pyrifoliae TaxID=79967 RepID=A0ABY5X924_ERWPY|nr:4'-phosphopantetheinyl transferase superfamily protein [Erwinia pyrifoliae]AUX74396.1 phosphopantetheinyl transferase [Erwinia pyrifoliae]MCA8875244.1 4'-phosphopantetheinyl transferase superfamily protein [Erwinia pyrifoliae]MCT2385439.1 4'-phosphopantetheinyl transferase superfamily protein [Erwinia pyrifoliae]MCU8588988.1 4'-phosphopantetheinyl transferase superfamily protein [Erwinia pyrifoliae]UWS29330.1 4'-phosphopantetheinyl transferase superfamily protein [Erwinia pyrifoliae]